ncbi:MAG TPA: SpoIIE family protein phosphatase [Chloroflexi bacterium]|nr:SpoIIE family protein phosphatase [Chloroflexota bacterium]
MTKSTDILRRVLGSLSVEDVAELNQVAVWREYPSGAVVCKEGELEHTFYVIESGMVSVTRRLNDDSDQVLGVLRDGQFFGEMGLLDDVPRAATIRTMTTCKLIELSEETFDALVARNPAVGVTLLRGITRSLRDTDRRAMTELELKNQALARALDELKAAQAELLQQERLKRDLEIASKVQRSILPAWLPTISGFEFSVQSKPAREVGGDFYDVIEVSDDCFALVVADVSGKSWQAAIFMAIVRALLLREASEHLSPAETMQKIHSQIMKTSTAEMFVTMFYGLVNTKDNRMRFVRAGHDRPILYRAVTRSMELLAPPGRFIGLWPELIIEEEETTLQPGDCLVCYSDGVPDARNAQGDIFGLDRLLAIVGAKGHLPTQELSAEIIESLGDFTGDTPQTDDITILLVKATEQETNL